MIGIWDVYQHRQIADLKAEQHYRNLDSSRQGEALRKEVLRIESKVDGLALICQALFEIVQEETNLTDKEIEKKIKAIDLRDGREDGKMTGKVLPCSNCNRPAHTRQHVCMYCGSAIVEGNAIEKALTPKKSKIHIK